MTRRRDLLRAGGASLLLAGCERPAALLAALAPPWLPVDIARPGFELGHWQRKLAAAGEPVANGGDETTDVVIVGGGIAGLMAAWTLARHGHRNVVHLLGPEPFGNAAARRWQNVPCPQGAHYLPLPTSECAHVRELLFDMDVMQAGVGTALPRYDERVLVHAPDERLLIDGRWVDGLLPSPGSDAPGMNEATQQQRFFAHVADLKARRGGDGKRLFALPIALASSDLQTEPWRALDSITFAQWLDREGYTAPGLRWYLDYACRDDFGAGANVVSAFAGLHYFASRNGAAANAVEHAVLTWPDGLNPVGRHLAAAGSAFQRNEMALRVRPTATGADVFASAGPGQPVRQLRARRVVLAVPLHVAIHLLPKGFLPVDAQANLPPQASWLVGNLALNAFPREQGDAELAWDNVVYGSQHLGWVVATHQWLRAAKPETTVFTTYTTLPFATSHDTRHWLENADADTLRAMACADLITAYGPALWRHAARLHITVRGHAMAVPVPGYLDVRKRLGLDGDTGAIAFAHSDLSGYSVFEEAAWWGAQAAQRCLSAMG